MELLVLTWKYRNEIAIAAIITVLIIGGLYIKHVFADRASLELEVVQLQEQIVKLEKQVVLNKEIVDAIAKIRVQSHNYVHVVETSATPTAGSSFVAIPNGVFNPTMFTTYSSTSTSSSNAGAKDSSAK